MRKVIDFLIYIYVGLVGLLSLIVLGYSLGTRVVWRQAVENDLYDVLSERYMLLAVSVVVVLAVLYFGRRWLQGRWIYATFAVAFLVSLFFVLAIRGIAVNDGGFLDESINQIMAGDYSSVLGGYLRGHPHFVGYVMIGQVLYLVFGPSCFIVYQLLNIASILVTVWGLYRITYEISGREAYCDLAAILSLGAMCLYAYSTLVYNDIWSIGPQVLSIYLTMRYLRTGAKRSMAGATLSIALACMIKTNCYIAMIAIALSLVMDGLRQLARSREARRVLAERTVFAVLVVVITYGTIQGENLAMARAAGLERMPGGESSNSYIAMGMHQVNDAGCVKNGWYDGTNAALYAASGYDTAVCAELASADIAESIEGFRETPKYFVKFYLYKFLQQWGDGTCSSLRQMEMSGRNVEPRSEVAEALMYGALRDVLNEIMNVFHTVYYLGAVLYFVSVFVRLRKGKGTISSSEAFLVMFILGGVLFHELWEASSRYVIRYYLCMIPLAAVGYGRLFDIKNSSH